MAGYSQTPLIRRLGLKDGSACVVNPPDNYFDLIAPLPDSVLFQESLSGKLGFIHLFVKSLSQLKSTLTKARVHLVENGQIWVSWPKKASRIPSDLDENVIRHVGLGAGLVDVKVCAIDETWSALKFVIPLKDRK